MVTPFPALPLDIERLILECSAEHDRGMALQLACLSSRVRQWIEPIIYRRVTIEYPSQAEAFIRTLEKKPVSFFENHVKSICFAYGIHFRQATKILSICNCLSSLACWIEPSQLSSDLADDENAPHSEYLNVAAMARVISSIPLRPRRLSVTLNHMQCTPDPDFAAPLLQRVTHLDIYQGSQFFRDWSWKGFNDLESLVYLSFDLSVSAPLENVYHVLSRAPKSLRVCLVLFSTRDSMMDSVEEFFEMDLVVQKMIYGDVDPRIVVGTSGPLKKGSSFEGAVVVRPYEEVLKDWSYIADGKDDMWMEAEYIIAHRQSTSDHKSRTAQ